MSAINTDPEIMHGVPCFAGTRVPVKSLFQHLAGGYNIDYFIYEFPTVTREQVVAVLEVAVGVLAPDPDWLVQLERREELEGQHTTSGVEVAAG